VRWRRRADTGRSSLLLHQYSARPAVAPELLPDLALVSGAGGGDANTALDPRDGHVLVRAHKGSNDTVAPGRVLLQTQRSDRGCGLEIVARSGRKSSARAGCGRVVGLATRASVRSGSGGLDSVDLRTGRVHHLGEVESSTVAGDRVLVRRSGHRLTAIDPGSGRKLWSRGFPGERPPEVSIAGGVVSVIGEPHGLNPFLDGDARSKGDELIVLDARTGEEKGSLVAAAGIRGTVALGDGRVLAVDRDGVHRVVG
jgi:outer membrane protein assembly factor BamB